MGINTQHAIQSQQDEHWMRLALKAARTAAKRGEVPVGSVLVRGQELICQAGNRKEAWQTPLGHAEVIALHRAALKESSWRLLGTTLYVTLEPCAMCAGALIQARVSRVVFGARDAKGGALRSILRIGDDPRLNHQFEITEGVLAQECGQILTDFFRLRRQDLRKSKGK